MKLLQRRVGLIMVASVVLLSMALTFYGARVLWKQVEPPGFAFAAIEYFLAGDSQSAVSMQVVTGDLPSENTWVELIISGPLGRIFFETKERPWDAHTLVWDGLDERGHLVPFGTQCKVMFKVLKENALVRQGQAGFEMGLALRKTEAGMVVANIGMDGGGAKIAAAEDTEFSTEIMGRLTRFAEWGAHYAQLGVLVRVGLNRTISDHAEQQLVAIKTAAKLRRLLEYDGYPLGKIEIGISQEQSNDMRMIPFEIILKIDSVESLRKLRDDL